MIARVLLALVSAAVMAVLALSFEAVRAEQRATHVAFGPEAGPAEIAAALNDARKARRLTPDASAELVEAFVLARAGRSAAAVHVLERVVRAEPENVDAWVFLSNEATDPRRAGEARRRALEVNPRLRLP